MGIFDRLFSRPVKDPNRIEPGTFHVEVFPSYFDAELASSGSREGTPESPYRLAVLPESYPGRALEWKGKGGERWFDLRKMQDPAVLCLSGDTLNLLKNETDLWQRVKRVTQRA